MSTQAEKQVQNGVNVEALLGARDALSKAPEAAKFNWRASCKWKNGTHSQTSIQGFYGLGQQQSHKTEFTFDTDHPEIFASEDKGATPVEMVLAGLAGCLTAGVASIAQLRKIQLRSVTATLESATATCESFTAPTFTTSVSLVIRNSRTFGAKPMNVTRSV